MLEPLKLYGAHQSKYLRPYWPLVLLLAVLLITSTGLQLITPRIVRRFLDIAHEQGALGSLYLAAMMFLVLGLSSQLLSAFTMYYGRDVSWRATNRLRPTSPCTSCSWTWVSTAPTRLGSCWSGSTATDGLAASVNDTTIAVAEDLRGRRFATGKTPGYDRLGPRPRSSLSCAIMAEYAPCHCGYGTTYATNVERK